MKINGKHFETIWLHPEDSGLVQVIDQRVLPHRFELFDIKTPEDCVFAIKEMVVRGAPLIGVTAAYGLYLACLQYRDYQDLDEKILATAEQLKATRPTAVNLFWAIERVLEELKHVESVDEKIAKALEVAHLIKKEDVEISQKIGLTGLEVIKRIWAEKNDPKEPVHILTHCNAGWLATVDYGTALAPIYLAHREGIPVHVYVDETRPRLQGAFLTAFELQEEGIPHTLIADNTGGHLMQHNRVDMIIVGSDRTTRNGDVANKIGTYLKALAAFDNNVPFYVALPSTSIDWSIADGLQEILIEERDQDEVRWVQGYEGQELKSVLICPQQTPALNLGFDVTPARLVTALFTERGTCEASAKGLRGLFPERMV